MVAGPANLPAEPEVRQADPQLRMAEDIAAQFRHLPEDQAVAAVAAHLRSFWDPRMRAKLLERVARDPDSVDPLVLAAAARL